MKTNPDQKQQGDVALERVKILPKGTKKDQRKGDIILAKGSATDHAHRIKSKTAELHRIKDQAFLVVKGASADLTHEEHKTISIPKGIWEVTHIHEHDYLTDMTRQVAD